VLGGQRHRALALRVVPPIRIVEETEAVLEPQHAPYRFVEERRRHAPSPITDDRWQIGAVDLAHHVDVDPGRQRQSARRRAVGGDAVIDQLSDSRPIADDDAIEAPFSTEHVGDEPLVRVRGHAGDLVERRHECRRAGAHCGVKGRQVHVPQRTLRHLGDVVIAPRLGGAVCGEVLCRRRDRVVCTEAASLEAAHARRGERRSEIRIFARALDDTPPPRVPRDVDHRRKGPGNAMSRGFDRGDVRRSLDRRRIPAAGFGERHRKDGAEAVNDVEREEQWDVQPRFLYGDALQGAGRVSPGDVEKGADLATTDLLPTHAAPSGPRRITGTRQLIELAELLGEGHAREERVDETLLARRLGWSDRAGHFRRAGRLRTSRDGRRDDAQDRTPSKMAGHE